MVYEVSVSSTAVPAEAAEEGLETELTQDSGARHRYFLRINHNQTLTVRICPLHVSGCAVDCAFVGFIPGSCDGWEQHYQP